jgi:peptide/nickel transport system substrate-binding protein
MKKHRISRREFLRVSALTAVGAVALSCQGPGATQTEETEPEPVETKEAEPEEEAAGASSKQAPAFAEMVAAGDLPPLEERLPADPMVVEPNDRIGQYGGTWHMGSVGSSDNALVARTAGYEKPLRWDKTYTEVVPNLISSWETSEDGKVFTLYLRKGVRWSDGELLTADDYLFNFNDRLMNEDLTPTFPDALTVGGETPTMEKVDDYTVNVKFPLPSGGFTLHLANVSCQLLAMPAHHFEQFHIAYVDEAEMNQMVEDAGFEFWYELFGSKNEAFPCCYHDIGRPLTYAWVPPADASAFGEEPQAVFNRNPYYWKVDPDGNQLPYIDQLFYKMHENPDTILLDAIAGDIDMQKRHIDKIENVPVLQENSGDGGYHFFALQRQKMNNCILDLNQNYEDDPYIADLNKEMDFRIALSHGIDREELVEVINGGRGEPWQAAPLPNSPFYSEELAKQYTEHDPDTANEMLDLFLPDKDDEGYRLRTDNGERLIIIAETAADFKVVWIDILELIKEQWKEIGIEMRIKTHDRAFYQGERRGNGQTMLAVWEGDIDYWAVYHIRNQVACHHLWTAWINSGGEQGEEPPEVYKEINALYEELKMTVGLEDQRAIIAQIHELYPFDRIGTTTIPSGYGVVKNNFYNVSEEVPDMWIGATPALDNTCQYWIDEEA